MELTLEDIKKAAKREDFRAGVQMRMLMPRLSVRVTRWVVTRTQVQPDQITALSFAVGMLAVVAFAASTPWVVALGLLGFHLHVMLDYVDGEVARCRGITSVKGAYFDLITDRITFPLFIFASGLAVYHQVNNPTMLIVTFVATFGLLLDKFAVDCWHRAVGGDAGDVEDRYVEAPQRTTSQLWLGRAKLLAVMLRGLTAFLTYTALAAFLDAVWVFPVEAIGSYRAAILWAFAPVLLGGAIVRIIYVYTRGEIPRRQQLL
jgi:phosphatidylglycerophosphate synthase